VKNAFTLPKLTKPPIRLQGSAVCYCTDSITRDFGLGGAFHSVLLAPGQSSELGLVGVVARRLGHRALSLQSVLVGGFALQFGFGVPVRSVVRFLAVKGCNGGSPSWSCTSSWLFVISFQERFLLIGPLCLGVVDGTVSIVLPVV
jgi:hypothetical protein